MTKSQSAIDSKVPIQAKDAMAQKLGTFQSPLPTEKNIRYRFYTQNFGLQQPDLSYTFKEIEFLK